MKSAERFITPELKSFEDKVLGARDRALAREKALYEALLDRFAARLPALQATTAAIAQNRRASLLRRARHGAGLRTAAAGGRTPAPHRGRPPPPVVERAAREPFVPNDVRFDDSRRMLIITGPNMGGKSTYMRQTALIVILAHIGCYVPARRAVLGPLDRIFTRIGASDDLAGGRSTFMLEMTETANILNNATAKSLVLMDEVGRGTSTFDGLSLAWACAAFIANQIRALHAVRHALLRAHQLAGEAPGVANVHVEAVEHGDTLIFLHSVKEGPANQSYGLQVAALAGIPKTVTAQAPRYLTELERERDALRTKASPQGELALFAPPAKASPSPSPAAPLESAALEALRALDPDTLSPREALDLLFGCSSWTVAIADAARRPPARLPTCRPGRTPKPIPGPQTPGLQEHRRGARHGLGKHHPRVAHRQQHPVGLAGKLRLLDPARYRRRDLRESPAAAPPRIPSSPRSRPDPAARPSGARGSRAIPRPHGPE